MPAPAVIGDLVARFAANRDAYEAPLYNETQLRREFLDPFFEALGWDVLNRQGYAEAYIARTWIERSPCWSKKCAPHRRHRVEAFNDTFAI